MAEKPYEVKLLYIYKVTWDSLDNARAPKAPHNPPTIALIEASPSDDYWHLKAREDLSENAIISPGELCDRVRGKLKDIKKAEGWKIEGIDKIGVTFDKPPQLPQFDITFDAYFANYRKREPLNDPDLEKQVLEVLREKHFELNPIEESKQA